MNPNERRRAQTRRNRKTKHLGDLMKSLAVAQFQPREERAIEGRTMKAQCKRLAGRSVLVGSTSFQFDDDGVCEVKPNGRGGQYYDFEVLLKMNGVVELKDEEKAPAEAEAAPAEPAPTAEKEDSEEEKTVEEELAAASFAPEMNDLLDDEEEKSDNKSKSKWKRGKKRNKKEND